MTTSTPVTTPNSARPINANTKSVDLSKKYADRVRHGKTAKDKGRGKPTSP